MDEHIILVDKDNNALGTAPKSASHHGNTPLHRAFSLFIFNSKGETLLQRRSKLKKTFPLIWSNSCCGHPQLNETNDEAVKKRVKHELGINLKKVFEILPNFSYTAEMNGIMENELCPVFVAFTDLQPSINKMEVEAFKWIDWEEFTDQVMYTNSDYSVWSKLETIELNSNDKFIKLFKEYVE